MGWILKSWRPDALAALADAEARQTAAEIVRGAERDARRLTRDAHRELDNARADLDALEQFGVETLRSVQQHRETVRSSEPAAEPQPAPQSGKPRGRRDRATLRDSPLTELFRSTASP
jgi:hypothetical protein